MKQILFLLVIWFFSITCSDAQDILYKKNGEELRVKVSEINATDIIFNYFDTLENLLYIIPKADVFMIKYANGIKEVFNSGPVPDSKNRYNESSNNNIIEKRGFRYYQNGVWLGKESVEGIILESKNHAAIAEMKLTKSSERFGSGLIISGIVIGSISPFVLFIGILDYSSYNSGMNEYEYLGIVGTAAALASVIAGTTVKFQAKQHTDRAIQIYNKGLEK